VETWVKPLQHNELAVCFLNRSVQSRSFVFDWKTNPVVDSVFNMTFDFSSSIYTIRNVWLQQEEGSTEKTYQGNLLPHEIIVLRLKPKK